MAYKVKQQKTQYEDLEIELIDGTIKTYTPNIDLDNIVKEYKTFVETINKLENTKDVENYDGNYYQDLGLSIAQLLSMVFGTEQTKDMINSFENNYVELINCLYPYFLDVIYPVVKDVNEERENYYKNALK